MAKVDASRFLSHLPTLFAPTIADGQEFLAYIDGDPNSLVIQGENILYPPASSIQISDLSYELKNTSNQINELQDKAEAVENLCRNIPTFISNIENISGSSEGLPDFEFDLLYFGIDELRNEFAALQEKINTLEAVLNSSNNNADDSRFATLTEAVSLLENKSEALQLSVDNLTSEMHANVVSEAQVDVSD